ncbi:hypothetical protein M9458_011622, partial [Cirrhinus mrigala]
AGDGEQSRGNHRRRGNRRSDLRSLPALLHGSVLAHALPQLGEIGSTCFSKGGMILCRNDYI